MKPIACALMVSFLLAGCGQAPGLAPSSAKVGTFAAKKNTSTRAAMVHVPADRMAVLADRYQQIKQKYAAPGQTVSAVIHVVVSNDGFKKVRHEAKMPASDLGGDHAFVVGMINAGVTPGNYEYYLVMKTVVFTQSKNRLEAEELEDFYVSDFGRNYPVVLQ